MRTIVFRLALHYLVFCSLPGVAHYLEYVLDLMRISMNITKKFQLLAESTAFERLDLRVTPHHR